MKTIKNIALLIVIITVLAFALAGCRESNTVSNYIISDVQYAEKADLESAAQPEQLKAGQDVYASIYFIESPKGMEYTAKWYIDGNEVKTDNQKMLTDRHGIIVFFLEGDKTTAGTLKFEVSYGSDVLASTEVTVVEE